VSGCVRLVSGKTGCLRQIRGKVWAGIAQVSHARRALVVRLGFPLTALSITRCHVCCYSACQFEGPRAAVEIKHAVYGVRMWLTGTPARVPARTVPLAAGGMRPYSRGPDRRAVSQCGQSSEPLAA
jgi:hypothetical protein